MEKNKIQVLGLEDAERPILTASDVRFEQTDSITMQRALPAQLLPLVWAQRTSAILKVFRCGPRHDIGGQELGSHVDKPRKEEAAGVLDQAMGKVRGRSGRRLRQGCC
ncbi:hypothetical protein DA792_13670 [Celeribacter baekdonensis]|uniref:Uncharacterized protein n=1 Tax=Celeribacter baekdonensis TaxID=875171 RepID=A0A2R4M4B4_9RHOB|nr:hypothetical protein DA792_13670 [Celeribacter baekdonensis]